MPDLSKDIVNNIWIANETQSSAAQTYVFGTAETYNDADIEFTVNIADDYIGPAANPEITSHNIELTSSDSNPSNIYVQVGENNKKYVSKIILETGNNIDFENDITNTVNLSYDSDLNALIVNFS